MNDLMKTFKTTGRITISAETYVIFNLGSEDFITSAIYVETIGNSFNKIKLTKVVSNMGMTMKFFALVVEQMQLMVNENKSGTNDISKRVPFDGYKIISN